MFGVLGESFYMVGNEKFYCFFLSKSIIEEIFVEEGYQIFDLKVFILDLIVIKGNCNVEGLFFFRGRFDVYVQFIQMLVVMIVDGCLLKSRSGQCLKIKLFQVQFLYLLWFYQKVIIKF